MLSKKMKQIYVLIIAICIINIANGQDSLITNIAKNNVTTIIKEQNNFSGTGWTKILAEANKSNYVLVGEEHFTNEIPFFLSRLTSEIKFDYFFSEIDPYSAKIPESKLKHLPPSELNKYVEKYGNTFSFFALNPEFQLLKKIIDSNTTVFGLDQITSVADRLFCEELQQQTKNKEAKGIYKMIADSSKKYFDNFLKDSSHSFAGTPFYMLTDDFEKKMTQLSSLQLSREETEIVQALKLTATIYKGQLHHLRIQLLKSELMKVYSEWNNKKNLFKYGTNHVLKGESLLTIYDIGNLVNNIADSKFQNSLHIMLIGKSGSAGSPFKGFPDQKVDENSNELIALKPFLNIVEGKDWYCFDMLPLRRALEDQKLAVNNIELSRIIKGFDFVIIISTVSAAKFIETE